MLVRSLQGEDTLTLGRHDDQGIDAALADRIESLQGLGKLQALVGELGIALGEPSTQFRVFLLQLFWGLYGSGHKRMRSQQALRTPNKIPLPAEIRRSGGTTSS